MNPRTPRRGRLLLLAVVALLVVSAGSATAAALVTGKQIKDGTVTGKDLRNGSVTGLDVKDFSLTLDDFNGSVQGPPGPAGPAGPAGPSGVLGIEYRTQAILVPAGQDRTWGVLCPAGSKVSGGGVSSDQPVSARVTESAPLNDGVGWTVGLRNTSNAPVTAYAWAGCVRTS